MHCIGEARTEQLDIVPAQLRVRVTRRPRYACRACECAVVVAPAPERPIDRGMPTEALIAHVVVSKFCDSLPLYRQTQMLARQGVSLDRATLSNWVGSACWWLTPLYELVLGTVLSLIMAFGAASNIAPRWLYYPCRWLMNVIRSLPELVFALMFVSAVGLGPFAGILAMTVGSVLVS